jgi:hypothetical protein
MAPDESPERTLRAFFSRFAPKQQKLIRSARAALRKRFPTAHELAYDYIRFIVVAYSPTERGIDSIVSFTARPDRVDLNFNNGPKLPDPRKLLRGSGKMARYLRLEAARQLAHPDVKALIAAATEHSKVPLPAKQKGSLIIKTNKTPVAKRRPGRKPAK